MYTRTGLPQSSLNHSLPARPAPSITLPLPSKPAFSLPSKPPLPAEPNEPAVRASVGDSWRNTSRSPSPAHRSRTSRGESYIPPLSRSPSPRRGQRYRPRSPSASTTKRLYRSPSPVSRRDNHYRPSPSPPPSKRYRTRSPTPTRNRTTTSHDSTSHPSADNRKRPSSQEDSFSQERLYKSSSREKSFTDPRPPPSLKDRLGGYFHQPKDQENR
ncbi:hypothetical protein IAT40_005083 [Kwoniella sp. CBS 6097]